MSCEDLARIPLTFHVATFTGTDYHEILDVSDSFTYWIYLGFIRKKNKRLFFYACLDITLP